MLNDQSLNIVEFGSGKAGTRLQENGLEPELCFAGVAFDMDVGWLLGGRQRKRRSDMGRIEVQSASFDTGGTSPHGKAQTIKWRLQMLGKRGKTGCWWVCGSEFALRRLTISCADRRGGGVHGNGMARWSYGKLG